MIFTLCSKLETGGFTQAQSTVERAAMSPLYRGGDRHEESDPQPGSMGSCASPPHAHPLITPERWPGSGKQTGWWFLRCGLQTLHQWPWWEKSVGDLKRLWWAGHGGHTCNLSTEGGGSWVWSQPGLHSEILSSQNLYIFIYIYIKYIYVYKERERERDKL
jgi:hypothetical protein